MKSVANNNKVSYELGIESADILHFFKDNHVGY
jgi:hypothetical protein